jgi:hypothetical protein
MKAEKNISLPSVFKGNVHDYVSSLYLISLSLSLESVPELLVMLQIRAPPVLLEALLIYFEIG